MQAGLGTHSDLPEKNTVWGTPNALVCARCSRCPGPTLHHCLAPAPAWRPRRLGPFHRGSLGRVVPGCILGPSPGGVASGPQAVTVAEHLHPWAPGPGAPLLPALSLLAPLGPWCTLGTSSQRSGRLPVPCSEPPSWGVPNEGLRLCGEETPLHVDLGRPSRGGHCGWCAMAWPCCPTSAVPES